jgi:metal-responsive CopG/Arc/MetJ family transcriptional regulator
MGRITSNVDEEVITRIDTLAAAEGLSRSEWIARAVIDRLAVEERGRRGRGKRRCRGRCMSMRSRSGTSGSRTSRRP